MLYEESAEFSRSGIPGRLTSPLPSAGRRAEGPSVPPSQLSAASGSGLPGLKEGLFSCSQWPAEPPTATLKTGLLLKQRRRAQNQGRRGSLLNTLRVCPGSPSERRPEASRRPTRPGPTSRPTESRCLHAGLWNRLFIGQAQGPIFSFPTAHPESCTD